MLAHALGTVNFLVLLAMAPAIQTTLGLSRTEFGMLATAYNGGLLAGALPSGWLVDRFGVRAGLMAAHVLMAVGTALLAAGARTLAAAAPCVVLLGVGYALVNPATVKAVLLWVPAQQRATAMGLKQTGVPLGGVLAAALGGLAARVDWPVLLWVVALATMGGAVLTWMAPRASDTPSGRGPRTIVTDVYSVMRDRDLTVLNTTGATLNLVHASFFTYLTLFLGETLQFDLPLASLCLAFAQAGSTVGRVAWGLASDRFCGGYRKPPLVTVWVMAAAGLVALAGMRSSAGVVAASSLALGLGATLASYAGLLQSAAAEAVPPRLGGAAIGYNMLLMPIGGMIGPPLFGYVVDVSGSYQLAWLLSGAAVLTSSLILGIGFRERHPLGP
jgi:predicted MFS family arabinose efflux permease